MRAVEEIALRVKRFSVKTFMDAWTLNIERLQQCCVHVGSTNGEANPVRVPFCARQLFGGLRRTRPPGMVQRASWSSSTTSDALDRLGAV